MEEVSDRDIREWGSYVLCKRADFDHALQPDRGVSR